MAKKEDLILKHNVVINGEIEGTVYDVEHLTKDSNTVNSMFQNGRYVLNPNVRKNDKYGFVKSCYSANEKEGYKPKFHVVFPNGTTSDWTVESCTILPSNFVPKGYPTINEMYLISNNSK